MEREHMTEEKPESKSMSRLDSKFMKTLLLIFAALFSFGGPYLVYVLSHLLELDFFASMAAGATLFIIGLVLRWYLIKKQILT